MIIMKKRGDIEMSFNMLFSIILIISFIAVAVYVIMQFLGTKECGDAGMFKQELQDKINTALASDGYTDVYSSILPAKINYACIADLNKPASGSNKDKYTEFQRFDNKNNLFFYPSGNVCSGMVFELKHINLAEITKTENPYCIKNSGKIEIKIEKGFEPLVSLSRK